LAEALPPLSAHEAMVEANRCLFCYDAPCTHACPTHIDIPRFIGKIVTENLIGSAKTILESNLLGATCARVCPVQELCEGACVLGKDHKPIMIGRLQRYAMDHLNGNIARVLRVAPATGKEAAVIGAGAAGLSCAGELAKAGHRVTLFERRPMPGGLSTYGIIALREPVDVALAEVEMIRQLGVEIETGIEVGRDFTVEELQARFDAIFLSVGLGATPSLDIPGEEYAMDGLDYIERSKIDRQRLSIGRQVIVIGAGNTAIDCATVAARLGAEQVTMIYRRTQTEMTAYPHEYEFIRKEGVDFRFLTQPVRILHNGGRIIGIECLRMRLSDRDESGRARPQAIPGTEFIIAADQVVKAIGQQKPSLIALLGLSSERGYVKVNRDFETSLPGVYAGGDCIRSTGSASTVMAVQDGKLAARAIHKRLMIGEERD
jgi:dihydropyrimidine dehydrogenase (NAD+) subunit PreT